MAAAACTDTVCAAHPGVTKSGTTATVKKRSGKGRVKPTKASEELEKFFDKVVEQAARREEQKAREKEGPPVAKETSAFPYHIRDLRISTPNRSEYRGARDSL